MSLELFCPFCREPISPADPTNYQRVIGWERNASRAGTRKGGGSDISLRELRDEWAHPACIAREKAGIHQAQESLI